MIGLVGITLLFISPPLRGQSATVSWQTLERRPLHLPVVHAGAACPASRGRVAHTISANFGSGIALGSGPAYALYGPFADAHGTVHVPARPTQAGWHYVKTLWMISPRYHGPVLVRGRRLDGTTPLRFKIDAAPGPELQIMAYGLETGGWTGQPSFTLVRALGCYAYQIDGQGFSEVIVFRVVP